MTFVRREDGTGREEAGTSAGVDRGRPITVDDLFVLHDFGPWPDGFRCDREEMYGDRGVRGCGSRLELGRAGG